MVNFIIGFVIGGVVLYFFMLMMKQPAQVGKKVEVMSEKEAHIAKLREYIRGINGKITNDMAQSELKVSDATAERYLDELEKSGLIKQVGKVGVDVYYIKN